MLAINDPPQAAQNVTSTVESDHDFQEPGDNLDVADGSNKPLPSTHQNDVSDDDDDDAFEPVVSNGTARARRR